MTTRECSPGIKIANMWLAGCMWADVLKAPWFQEMPDFLRTEGAHVWMGLEQALELICSVYVTNPEQAYNLEYVKRRTRERKRRRR